jgi:hypothetical protein
MPTIFAERMEIIRSQGVIDEALIGLIAIACAETLVTAGFIWEPEDYERLRLEIDEAYKGVEYETAQVD